MARLDWKRFRDEEPKVGSRIIRALYDRNRKNVHGLRNITYYVDTWTSRADIQKLRDWERAPEPRILLRRVRGGGSMWLICNELKKGKPRQYT